MNLSKIKLPKNTTKGTHHYSWADDLKKFEAEWNEQFKYKKVNK